jgi:hypothetical protein
MSDDYNPYIYVYVCTAMGCEDRQKKFCGYSYGCPFCGEGKMILDDDKSDEASGGEIR